MTEHNASDAKHNRNLKHLFAPNKAKGGPKFQFLFMQDKAKAGLFASLSFGLFLSRISKTQTFGEILDFGIQSTSSFQEYTTNKNWCYTIVSKIQNMEGHMTFIRYLVLIGILLALGVPSAKADVRIDCPIDRAEVKIINPLPNGWSATPRVERLRDTRMDRIGGRKALICRYGSVGSIQFEQPPNTDCRTTRTGFVCRDERRPGPDRPETYRTGQLDIPQTFLFDLDQGRVTDAGADIWYQAENRTRKFLTPRNGAELSISGRRNRGYGDCARADFSANSIPLASIPLGTYICVRTNDGRISEFRINAIIPNGPTDTIRIGFTTWRNER